MDALIGYTGFVGGNINNQRKFDILYNLANIEEIGEKSFELLVCAGVRAEKWKANNEPEADLANIKKLIDNLKSVKAKKFVLISTVDVYPLPIGIDEDEKIDENSLLPYGKNRLFLEKYARDQFKDLTVVRLPGLFGDGLKKNFIFDLINKNALDYTHKDSVFQFYNLARIWKDIQIAVDNKLDLVNFATEPISAHQVAKDCFGIDFKNVTERPPAKYDMHSKYAKLFNSTQNNYLYNKTEVLEDIKQFVK